MQEKDCASSMLLKPSVLTTLAAHRLFFNFIDITHKTSNITPLCKPFRKIGHIKLKGDVYKVKIF